jgi:hypothetical protein
MIDSKPTIEDVARLAGVSRATASRVINDAPGASGPLRSRVQQAVAQLGYRPNETARALASGRQRTVDLIAADYHPNLSRRLLPCLTTKFTLPLSSNDCERISITFRFSFFPALIMN